MVEEIKKFVDDNKKIYDLDLLKKDDLKKKLANAKAIAEDISFNGFEHFFEIDASSKLFFDGNHKYDFDKFVEHEYFNYFIGLKKK